MGAPQILEQARIGTIRARASDGLIQGVNVEGAVARRVFVSSLGAWTMTLAPLKSHQLFLQERPLTWRSPILCHPHRADADQLFGSYPSRVEQ